MLKRGRIIESDDESDQIIFDTAQSIINSSDNNSNDDDGFCSNNDESYSDDSEIRPEPLIVKRRCVTTIKPTSYYNDVVTPCMNKYKQRELVYSLLSIPYELNRLAIIIDSNNFVMYNETVRRRQMNQQINHSKVVFVNGDDDDATICDDDDENALKYNVYKYHGDVYEYINNEITNQKLFLFWGDFMSGYKVEYRNKFKSARTIFSSLFTKNLIDNTIIMLVLYVNMYNTDVKYQQINDIANDIENCGSFTIEYIKPQQSETICRQCIICKDTKKTSIILDGFNHTDIYSYSDRKLEMLYLDFKLSLPTSPNRSSE